MRQVKMRPLHRLIDYAVRKGLWSLDEDKKIMIAIVLTFASFLIGGLVGLLVFHLLLSIVAFIMAFVMLNRVKDRNPKYLMTWVTFCTVCFIIELIWILHMLGTTNGVAALMGTILGVSVITFGMSLVHNLKLEIYKNELTTNATPKNDDLETPDVAKKED